MCPICSKIPDHCSSSQPEIQQLVAVTDTISVVSSILTVLECPACHQRYVYEMALAGESTFRSWDRCKAEQFFPNHQIVKLSIEWGVVGPDRKIEILEDGDAIARLIARDPPRVTGDLALATRYAIFVDEIEHYLDLRDFGRVRWKTPLSEVERLQVAAARIAMKTTAERDGDRVVVRSGVASAKRLIRRAITVHPDGNLAREDVVLDEDLPIARRPDREFESLDAFREHCGEPSMPLAECAICAKLPDRWSDSDAWIPELDRLLETYDGDIRSCPLCGRTYFYESLSLGNDIYTGNDSSTSYTRHTPEVLFDLAWGVKHRLPDADVSWIWPERYFTNHVLVSFGGNSWGALDHDNRLTMLESREAIADVIGRDPPRVTGDLELAKRYALFLDEREFPYDDRPGRWDLIRWDDPRSTDEELQLDAAKSAAGIANEMAPTAAREGDRVIVRSWILRNRRLICRIITIDPDGRYIREDAVIAENLPIR